MVELSPLPVPSELAELLSSPGAAAARDLAAAIEAGAFGASHRAVLINAVARVEPAGLVELAGTLGAIDPAVPGHGLAAVLADLAVTRHRMLDELHR